MTTSAERIAARKLDIAAKPYLTAGLYDPEELPVTLQSRTTYRVKRGAGWITLSADEFAFYNEFIWGRTMRWPREAPTVFDVLRKRQLDQQRDDERADRRRMIRAAHNPLSVIEPTRMANSRNSSQPMRCFGVWSMERKPPGRFASSLYIPDGFPAQLPGRSRWPEGEHHLQEASWLKVMRPEDRGPRMCSLEPPEGVERPDTWLDSQRTYAPEADHLVVPTWDGEDERRVYVLDAATRPYKSKNHEAQATGILLQFGFTRCGEPESTDTRGKSVNRDVECVRRARFHAANHGTSLDELRQEYKTVGKADPMMYYRRAVATRLRWDGFSARQVGLVLNRSERNAQRLVANVEPLLSTVEIKDNWSWHRPGDALPRHATQRWIRWRDDIGGDLRRGRASYIPEGVANARRVPVRKVDRVVQGKRRALAQYGHGWGAYRKQVTPTTPAFDDPDCTDPGRPQPLRYLPKLKALPPPPRAFPDLPARLANAAASTRSRGAFDVPFDMAGGQPMPSRSAFLGCRPTPRCHGMVKDCCDACAAEVAARHAAGPAGDAWRFGWLDVSLERLQRQDLVGSAPVLRTSR